VTTSRHNTIGLGMPARATAKTWLVAALLVAAACRLGVFLAFPSVFDFVATRTVHGSEAFDTYARNLVATAVWGHAPGVPDAAIPPVYGVVLAGTFAAFGRSAAAVAGVQTAFDLLSIALLASLGASLFRRPAVGVLAAFAAACYPYLVFQTLVVNDTALFILELVAFLWLLERLRDGPPEGRSVAAVAAGVVLGLGTLTRPAMLLVGAAAGAWLLLRLPFREAARRLVPAGLAAALVLGLWAARNARVFGRFVPIATNGGSNFWQGNNARTRAFLRAGYDAQWISPGALGGADFRDPASDGIFFRAGLQFLRDHPSEIPKLLWEKARTQWSLDIAPRRNPSPGAASELPGVESGAAVAAYSGRLFDAVGRTVHRVFWGTALALACVGLVASRRAWRDVSLAWAAPAGLTISYVLFHPSTRYRLPGDLTVFLFSAAGVLALVERLRRAASEKGASAAKAAPGTARRDVSDVHHDGLQEQLEPDEKG